MNQFNFPTKSLGFKAEDLKHLYEQIVAQMRAFGNSLAQAETGKVYRLAGAEWTVSGQAFSVTAGFLFFNSELYEIEAWNGTATGAQLPVLELDDQAGAHEPHNLYEGNLNVGTHTFTRARKLRPRLDASGTGIANYNEVLPSPLEKVNSLVGIQQGMIIDYYGSLGNFDGTGLGLNSYAGFALCNGQNGTPDLGGRVTVGHTPAEVDYNAIGKTGGAKEVALTEAGLPPHAHGYKDSYYVESLGTPVLPAGGAVEDVGAFVTGSADTDANNNYIYYRDRTTSTTGDGNPHENRQPYFVLAKIMKL